MHKSIFCIIAFALLLGRCNQSKIANDNGAVTLSDGIATGTPESVGMDMEQIHAMTEAVIHQEYPNLHSILIVKNGKLVYENYFPGKDEIWGRSIGEVSHTQDSLHDVRSISKSIVSACIGIAIAQGKIKGEEQKIWDFFPEYKDLNVGDKSKLTIRHLLTMTSGLDWNESIPYTDPANSEIQMDKSPDPIQFVLSRPLVSPPGTTWNYNGGATEVLAAIIKKVSGLEVDEYAREYLFKPLDITHSYWTKFPLRETGRKVPAAASGLRLRSRDMLKFGLLYMHKGKWNAKQILPENWVIDSHTSFISRGDSTEGYGYQFWMWKGTLNNKSIPIVAAVGNGDQRIYMDYENDLLVVVTAGNYNQWQIEKNSWALLQNFVYPSFLK